MKYISLIIITLLMNLDAKTQSWLDTTLYPFESNYLELNNGKMHYIDEGEGETILFIHGTPTWSFLYREHVKYFSKNFRCIAIDHLGFGLSQKSDTTKGTPEWHSKNLSEFIQKMNLKNITLVVHDFGGPIGLGAAIQNDKRINKIILFNTWLWSTKENKEAIKINKIVNSWFGKFMYLRLNVSPKYLLKRGFENKKNLPKSVHRQYVKPFPDKKSRKPLLDLATELVGSSDWYQKQWEQLNELEQKKWLILWGIKDDFITQTYLQKWKKKLPEASVKKYECGHFVQEEATEESIQEMEKFLSDKRN